MRQLVLFDIDGTLTTGNNNYQTVQKCLDKNYAVGICTAGAMYNPGNILQFHWMPTNLYKFMKKHNFDTFNNVASGILMGKDGRKIYEKALKHKPKNIFWPGWLKAVAMEKTGDKYKTTNVILYDNSDSFIEGVHAYNPNFRVICAGHPCGKVMTPNTIPNNL